MVLQHQGKGTLTKRLAEDFNLFYLETGIFYRVIGKVLKSSKKNNIKKIFKQH